MSCIDTTQSTVGPPKFQEFLDISCSLRIRVLFIWMACARESHFVDFDSIQVI